MVKDKRLSKKQLAVIDDLFAGRIDEQTVLDKHKVTRNIYSKWMSDELFNKEFNQRIVTLNRHSELVIARFASYAAAKLVALIDSKKEETARKACLDVITMPILKTEQLKADNGKNDDESQSLAITPEKACKLLAVLAETTQQNDDNSSRST